MGKCEDKGGQGNDIEIGELSTYDQDFVGVFLQSCIAFKLV